MRTNREPGALASTSDPYTVHPHMAGMLGLAHRGFRLPSYGHHLAQVLSKQGVYTTLAGVEHATPDGSGRLPAGAQRRRHQRHVQHRRPGTAVAPAAFLDSGPPEPFFLSVGQNETHRPFPVAEPEAHPPKTAATCRCNSSWMTRSGGGSGWLSRLPRRGSAAP